MQKRGSVIKRLPAVNWMYTWSLYLSTYGHFCWPMISTILACFEKVHWQLPESDDPAQSHCIREESESVWKGIRGLRRHDTL
jgi:hypothetical protein